MNEDIMSEYSKLIYSLTHYFDYYGDREDLYQAGCIGLITAYQNYDESYGTKFSTYAYPYILGEMKKLVREDKGIKISRKLTTLNSKINNIKAILEQRLMREPTLEEIAMELGVLVSDLEEATLAIQSLIYLDAPIKTEEKEMTLSDTIASHDIDMNTLIALKEELKDLEPLERKLVLYRFVDYKTQSEVADILGMNQVQVSRFERKVKDKIKSKLVA